MRILKNNRPGAAQSAFTTQPIEYTEDIAWYLSRSWNLSAPVTPTSVRGDFDWTT